MKQKGKQHLQRRDSGARGQWVAGEGQGIIIITRVPYYRSTAT